MLIEALLVQGREGGINIQDLLEQGSAIKLNSNAFWETKRHHTGLFDLALSFWTYNEISQSLAAFPSHSAPAQRDALASPSTLENALMVGIWIQIGHGCLMASKSAPEIFSHASHSSPMSSTGESLGKTAVKRTRSQD